MLGVRYCAYLLALVLLGIIYAHARMEANTKICNVDALITCIIEQRDLPRALEGSAVGQVLKQCLLMAIIRSASSIAITYSYNGKNS